MIAARQARTADRDPYLLPEARLEIDAGREGERVAQADDRLVGIIFIADDIGAAGRLRRARFGGAGRGGGGDDARRVAFGRLGGVGRCRRANRHQGTRTTQVNLYGFFILRPDWETGYVSCRDKVWMGV